VNVLKGSEFFLKRRVELGAERDGKNVGLLDKREKWKKKVGVGFEGKKKKKKSDGLPKRVQKKKSRMNKEVPIGGVLPHIQKLECMTSWRPLVAREFKRSISRTPGAKKDQHSERRTKVVSAQAVG